jgi:hypothetical protein
VRGRGATTQHPLLGAQPGCEQIAATFCDTKALSLRRSCQLGNCPIDMPLGHSLLPAGGAHPRKPRTGTRGSLLIQSEG